MLRVFKIRNRHMKIHDLPEIKREAAMNLGNPVSSRTYKKYAQVINVMIEWMETYRAIVYVDDLTRGDILDLLKTLDNSHRRITTCNSIKRDLKSMLRAAGREDLGALVKQKKEPRRNKAMNDDNLARLLAVASIRDSAMLLFLRHTGVRRQTIPRVTLKNLLMWVNDQNEQMLAYKNIVEKGGTPRGVYVKNENLCNAIKLWLGVRAAKHNPDYLFTSHYTGQPISQETVGKIFQQLREKANLPKGANINPHALRHRKAQEMLTQVDARIVSDFLGHDLNTLLKTYATRTDDEIARQVLGENVPDEFWGE